MDSATLSRIVSRFAPASEGPERELIHASLQSLDFLAENCDWLCDLAGSHAISIDDLAGDFPATAKEELAAVFNRHGSDKSSFHDYHKLYSFLLSSKRSLPLTIVEIGLGTTNPQTMSNMGPTGTPGASLRAFAEYCPNAQIFGGDIDRSTLFREDRIQTAFCNQMAQGGFTELNALLAGRPVDLFIDDGLHVLKANLASLRYGLSTLGPSGAVVIEDIPERMTWFWRLTQAMLGRSYECNLLRCLNGFVFFCQRPMVSTPSSSLN